MIVVREPGALLLVEAVERFLGAARRVRKRRKLARLQKGFAAALGQAFVAQGRAFVRRLQARRDLWPVQEAAGEEHSALIWDVLALFAEASAETRELFIEAFQAAAGEAMTLAARDILANVKTANVAASFTLENPRAVAYLESRGAEMVRQIDETTRQRIRGILVDGAKQGHSVGQIAKAITEKFAEFAEPRPQGHIKNRAELVAATELGNAYEESNAITARMLADGGYVVEKFWQTVGGGRVSAECQANQDAGWIPLDQAFPSGKMRPLQHPACRCDCLIRAREPQEAVRLARIAGEVLLEESNPHHDKRGRFARGTGGSGSAHADFANLIGKLNKGALHVGSIQPDIVKLWTSKTKGNLGVVVTASQRRHYLQHPEMIGHEKWLKDALLDPEEVHRSKTHASRALFYKKIPSTKDAYLRVVVEMQPSPGQKKHAVWTAFEVPHSKMVTDAAYRVWKKK